MIDINHWMIQHGYAKNEFNASHIFKGLDLGHEPRFWARVKRIMLYRRWRTSQIFSTTLECYEAAKRGERPSELELA